jgi:nicotinate phosphoribosyltransferase
MFQTATFDEIKEGKVTDVYFERTIGILKTKGIDKHVKAEFIAKELPDGAEWAVFAGLEEVAEILKGMKVNVRAMDEGTVFRVLQPVMEIEGMYTDFGVYETAILGLICQASGIATRSARCKMAAGERKVISFGARRMHPVMAPMIERNAYVGGCDGVAVIKSAELIEEEPMGTMPHALILVLGDVEKAIRAFDEVIEPHIKRTALVDTLIDEKFESIKAAEALGGKLFAVRLDTPGSRRGNFYRIIEEVKWELDIRGFGDVKIFVSGGINEEKIRELNPVVDAYGVGTWISNSPVIDFAMDIMEIEGRPHAKRGKWSGSKSVLRCGVCGGERIVPYTTVMEHCDCGGLQEDLLKPFIKGGELVRSLPRPREIRDYVLNQVRRLS